jgi:hypothetical protein
VYVAYHTTCTDLQMCAEKGDSCDPDNGGDFVVDQASRMDPAAGPGVYAPYGPLYMYTLVSLYCTYQHIGGSLVVPEVHLHEGRETACKVVLMFMHLAVKLQA